MAGVVFFSRRVGLIELIRVEIWQTSVDVRGLVGTVAGYTCNMKELSVQSAAPHRVLQVRWPFIIGDRYLERFLLCRDRTTEAQGEREGK